MVYINSKLKLNLNHVNHVIKTTKLPKSRTRNKRELIENAGNTRRENQD